MTVAALDDRVSVIALSPRGWRVSDPAKAEQDGLALIGFVERVNEAFEATLLQSPSERAFFCSLEDAITALVRGTSAMARRSQ